MAEEFGSNQYSNDNPYSNSGKAKDNRAQGRNAFPSELHDYSKQKETSSKTKSGTGHSFLRSISTAAAAAAAVVVILPSVISPSPDVRFEYLNATDTVIEYLLSFENVEEGEEMIVLVVTPNGNTVDERSTAESTLEGTVTGLNAGARYDIVVKSGSSTVATRSVTMAKKAITRAGTVEHECRCAIDKMFHFRFIGFLDENGYWSDFGATLTDMYGNESSCTFSDPTLDQTLAVSDAGMRGNLAILRIFCTTVEPDENGDTTPREYVLYEAEVSI